MTNWPRAIGAFFRLGIEAAQRRHCRPQTGRGRIGDRGALSRNGADDRGAKVAAQRPAGGGGKIFAAD
jgi:hypothetical protein